MNGRRMIQAESRENSTRLRVTLLPLHSMVVVFGNPPEALPLLPEPFEGEKARLNPGWTRSICKAIDYPQFTEAKEACLPDDLAEEKPEFSGFVRYEKRIALDHVPARACLTVTDAYEGVEVFINGHSLGIQVVPPFQYEVTPHLQIGENSIVIEVATTLERENAGQPDRMQMYMGLPPKQPACPSGINGQVIWTQKEE